MKEIKLTQGQIAFVDDEDYDFLMKWKWFADKGHTTFYARARHKGKHIKLHRIILGVTNPEVHVDHKDHNGLNNCKSNLRIATRSQNKINQRKLPNKSSQFIGVSYSKREGKWYGYIKGNGKRQHLGLFKDEKSAALAYNEAAKKYYGEFATLNQIQA